MMGVEPFAVPQNLLCAVRKEHRDSWLARVPARLAELQTRWSITIGAPFEPGGQTAWVAPARDGSGRDLVIKVMWRHPEATHEADGLREWDGNGTVRLFAVEAFDDTIALLIERCRPGTTLAERPESEQDVVIAQLLQRLWLPELSLDRSFEPLHVMCDQWADHFEQTASDGPPLLDAGLARDGVALFRTLPRTADRSVLLCTDLHAENVLAAQREPWLMIDPKPYVGDPTYDALQHMLNCDGRLHAEPVRLCRRMARLVDLDPERLAVWLFARCVIESVEWPELATVARQLAP